MEVYKKLMLLKNQAKKLEAMADSALDEIIRHCLYLLALKFGFFVFVESSFNESFLKRVCFDQDLFEIAILFSY